MLVIIRSAPETDEARRALKIASDTASDIVLIQNGVSLAKQGGLEGFGGTAYALMDDLALRGAGASGEGVKSIDYAEFVDLMADSRKVLGIF